MKRKAKKICSLILTGALLLGSVHVGTKEVSAAQNITLTFSDSGITQTVSGNGYEIDGTTLKITASGTYYVTGSCSEGTIVIGKELTDVNLVLDDLSLASSTTAPIVVKKGTTAAIVLEGTSTLTDNEDATTEETNTDFEGAGIKVKSTSALTIYGNGTLNVNGNAKNGIKGASEASLTVNSGTFNVTAADNGISFDGSILINNGTFTIDAGNDALKSDPDDTDTTSAATVTINAGTFAIDAGDDAIQAVSTLTIGTENGYERDPQITINSCYEGLEATYLYAYSGKVYIVSSDDGINTTDKSASTDTTTTEPGDNTGGMGPGGSTGGMGPGGMGPGGNTGGMGSGGQTSSNCGMYIYGGDFYVNAVGDGLDSNGGLYLYGGNITVMGQATGGDNSPLDSDGELVLQGATVFAAGTNPMNESPAASSQKYYTSTTSRSAGTIVNITYGGSVVYSDKLLRNCNYILYSSPDMTSTSCTVSTAQSVSSCASNAWAHNWDNGVVTTKATSESDGLITYTCEDCGEIERKTIPATTELPESEEESVVYTATFVTDSHATIDVYYTQDYTTPSETDVTTAVARNSTSGATDGTGDGQINFIVNVEDGYQLSGVTVDGTYKNLKEIDTTTNTYRITKIGSDLTVTVTTEAVESESYLKGDVNNDGTVDVLDMEAIQKSILGIEVLTGAAKEAGLVSGSGTELTVMDMEVIQKYILGLGTIS